MQRAEEQPLPAWGSPESLGFIALGIGIFSAMPYLCGWVHPMSAIATVPWGITALIVYIIVTIILFRNRNFFGATAFGVLGIILSGAIALKAGQGLMMLLNGVTAPPPLLAGGPIVEGMIWVAIAIVLVPIGFLAGYMTRCFAYAIWLADVGVGMLAAVNFGMVGHTAAIVGGYFIFLLGIWFLYIGIAALVNGTLRRPVIPVGKPLVARPTPPRG
jgi:hypothetical protein